MVCSTLRVFLFPAFVRFENYFCFVLRLEGQWLIKTSPVNERVLVSIANYVASFLLFSCSSKCNVIFPT